MAKASELLEQSADPFDKACLKVKELERVLHNLVMLKQYKNTHGKDELYLREQPKLWRQAKHLLDME